MQTQDILAEATRILGQPVRIDQRRGWATWWCPFHPDAERAGQRKQPNFGINLEEGNWKCLRCGTSGPSLKVLEKKLGTWTPPPLQQKTTHRRVKSHVEALDEALAEARSALMRSPAVGYLNGRGIRQYTALVYGLGYGVPVPAVHRSTLEAAKQSMLVRRDGAWLWAGGVVYADPPTQPTVLNVRYIPDDQLPRGTRSWTPKQNHHSWGNRLCPLGSWRITPATKLLVVVEGLFDMLMFGQALHDRQMYPEVVAVYTNGASPAYQMLEWFAAAGGFEYLLVPDPDEAGEGWTEAVVAAIRSQGNTRFRVVETPDGLDPDEAILAGWWPKGV